MAGWEPCVHESHLYLESIEALLDHAKRLGDSTEKATGARPCLVHYLLIRLQVEANQLHIGGDATVYLLLSHFVCGTKSSELILFFF